MGQHHRTTGANPACELAGVVRSTVYAPHMAVKPDKQELTLLGLIDAEYTRHSFYGSRPAEPGAKRMACAGQKACF